MVYQGMEISVLKSLVNSVTCFSQLPSCESITMEQVKKYHLTTEEIMKLLKPILDAVTDADVISDEMLQSAIVGLVQYGDEIKELCVNWQPLTSKIYFVLQAESLISKIRDHGLEILELLKSSDQCLPSELTATSLENIVQKIKTARSEQFSLTITKAIKDHAEGLGVSSDDLAELSGNLDLKSNQELLIEAVALEKLKENAEQAEKTNEVEYIDQMIELVTHMHDCLVSMKQSEISNPVTIPTDFCCPLSLDLMTDPVIVASGQTYERAFIRNWIDLGLTVCPKTRQTLAHTNLIPNYTVKALIASWCETNNVKLPDPAKPVKPFTLLANSETGKVNRINSCGTPATSSPLVRSPIPSPSHPLSFSESSAVDPANGHVSDTEIASSRSSDDRSDHSGERNLNLTGTDENPPQGNNLTNSATSMRSNSNHSQGTAGESSDVSGELSPDTQPAANVVAAVQRDLDFPSRLEMRSRGPSLWRRPNDRFASRLASSAPVAEVRPDLVEVENQVKRLVEDLQSGSIDVQRSATSEIRLLAKHNMDNRIVISGCGTIGLLVGLLRSADPTVQENSVTALLNLSINDNNKSAIANAGAIEPLIHVLENGSPEAKENSAATLFSLSVIEENKVKIGRSGAIKPLVDLLGNGTPRGKKDAATALFNLSINHENKGRIVQAGAVRHLVELMEPAFGMVDKAVAVLSNLATIQEGRSAIGQEGGIPVLVEVVELGSARGKENAAAALLQLCTNSSRFCNMVLREGAVPPLVVLSQSGTPRAREKAQQLLSYFRNQRHGSTGRS